MDGLDGDEVETSLVFFGRNLEEAEEAAGLPGGRSGYSGSHKFAVSSEDATQVFKDEEVVRGLSFVALTALGEHENANSRCCGCIEIRWDGDDSDG